MSNNFFPLTAEELVNRINKIPKVKLAVLPTPLEYLPNISKDLEINLYIKRDDCTALAFGGNKTRHLEFIMAKAVSGDYDCILTGAGSQSNWCRQTVAAANKLNLETFLVLMHGIKGNKMQGNFLLYNILGANVDIVEGENIEDIPGHLDKKYEELIKQGRKPLLIKGGFDADDTVLAGISYANAMAEIDVQMRSNNFMADHLILTATNMTQAGCDLGSKILGWPTRIHGISPVYFEMDIKEDIARICNQGAKMLDVNLEFTVDMINNDNGYVGEKYGVPTPEGLAAMRTMAKKEGIILDPVYTSKGFSALIDYVKKGIIKKNQNVIFIFTGGTPAVFAYSEEITSSF
ncbi:MAG: L-cysteate sulfo-lyase [Alphaproteobacteria bacterium MarineAlpha6_Bin2]|nr:MAG: L-cysteate sulfo-lyase [Alphaproteobacteria bacterium MarineAlpha6_Bin2]